MESSTKVPSLPMMGPSKLMNFGRAAIAVAALVDVEEPTKFRLRMVRLAPGATAICDPPRCSNSSISRTRAIDGDIAAHVQLTAAVVVMTAPLQARSSNT